MTPSDVKAIRLIANYLGIDGVGYNPRENNEQAAELAAKFDLFVEERTDRQKARFWVAEYRGRELAAMGGHEKDKGDHRRYVIVFAAAELIAPGWRDVFNCHKEGLDPFEIGHIVDARR